MRKKRKEPVETAAGQRAETPGPTENPETPISRGLFPIYIFLVTVELEHIILVNYFQVWKTPTRSPR